MVDPSEPRFDDAALAVILRRAAQLQAEAEASVGTGVLARHEGFSASELRQIAAEAGIEPRFVDAAMARGGAEPVVVASGALLGGPTRYRLEATIPGDLDPEQTAVKIAAIRRAAEHQGEVRETSLGVEWHSHGEPTQIAVNLTRRAGATAVEVVGDLGGTAVLTSLGTFLPWLLLTISLGAGLGLGLGYGLALFSAGLCGWLLTVSQVWRRLSQSRRARLERILEATLAEEPVTVLPALPAGDASDDDRDAQ